MWSGAIAEAGPLDASLRGDYSVTFMKACKIVDATAAFDVVIRGKVSYDGAGNGNFVGEALAVDPASANATNQTCTVTYTVNADGTFTQQLNCNLTFTNGPNAGNTATLTGIIHQGQLSLDGTVNLVSDVDDNVETFTITSGPQSGFTNQRICNGSGVATSRR
jgi:hypothetical protein